MSRSVKSHAISGSARKINLRAWVYFFVALLTLAIAMLAALASQVASANNQIITGAILALIALGLAGAISVTVVPYLARRVGSEWVRYKVSYRITREGWIYFGVTVLVGLSAVNTGNNLLFIVLSAMLASIIISGVASRVTLSRLELSIDFPERIFAFQPALATVSVCNRKRWGPSFSVSVEPNLAASRVISFEKIYFPFLSRASSQKRRIELNFQRRGMYSQSALKVSTRFPFGFIVKSMGIPQHHEMVVFPSIRPVDTYYEILPLISGEFESYSKGWGMDLYSVRNYAATDSARMIHWKASAKSEMLKVKEYAREDERRLVLIFDPMTERILPDDEPRFEAAISLCACLASHFFSEGADLSYLKSEGTLLEGNDEATLDQIFCELALLEMRQGRSRLIEQVESLPSAEKDSFKIVFTLRSPGTLPTPLWQSSHVIFIREKVPLSNNLPASS
jgi:hypothetical protein